MIYKEIEADMKVSVVNVKDDITLIHSRGVMTESNAVTLLEINPLFILSHLSVSAGGFHSQVG